MPEETNKVDAGDLDVEERSQKKMKLAPPGESELSEKISKQLDYYFSDVNIIKDKFLLEELKKDDGWVPLSTLLTFVRLKQLSSDQNRVVQALKEFESDTIELNEEKKQVRRRKPLPDVDEYKKQLDARTVHIAGFPTDYNFENLRRFCAQYGEVESVAMRRHFKTRFFKGCVHVVYKNEEDAKKVLATEVLKCKDRELRSESMENYYKRKAEKVQKLREKRKKPSDKKEVEQD